jgi:hypothetical protein
MKKNVWNYDQIAASIKHFNINKITVQAFYWISYGFISCGEKRKQIPKQEMKGHHHTALLFRHNETG